MTAELSRITRPPSPGRGRPHARPWRSACRGRWRRRWRAWSRSLRSWRAVRTACVLVSSGLYLRRFAWTPIVRHRMVPGTASVDDPALADFWARRRRRSNPPLASSILRLLQAQDGRCPLCGTLLLHADQQPQHPEAWEQWFKAVRQAIRKSAVTADTGDGPPDEPAAARLVHTHCHRRVGFSRWSTSGGPALLSACEPPGACLSRMRLAPHVRF